MISYGVKPKTGQQVATERYGDVQIVGNLERVVQDDSGQKFGIVRRDYFRGLITLGVAGARDPFEVVSDNRESAKYMAKFFTVRIPMDQLHKAKII